MVLLPAPLGPEMMTGRVSTAGLDCSAAMLMLLRALEILETGAVEQNWRWRGLRARGCGCGGVRIVERGANDSLAEGESWAEKLWQMRVGASKEVRRRMPLLCGGGCGMAQAVSDT